MAHGLPTSELEIYWMSIEQYHLSYLNAEESPKKIAEKEKLENIIKSFLCRIPHNQKFLVPTTAQIFRKSVVEVKNFSIVKLSNAWTVIGLYAQNLISQPWRREFHKIRMFSGYYEHNVRNILIGGEQMLMYMGYEHIGDGVMCLDGPVDPDRVALVSKDCFIASAECQVMFQISSEMIGRSNNITYEVIYNFREQNICDMSKAISELSSHHQRPHSMYSTMGLPYGPSACSRTLAHSSRTMKESMDPHQQWHRGNYEPEETYYNSNPSLSHIPPNYIYSPNFYQYSPAPRAYHQTAPPIYHSSVPTGQLIEFESPQTKSYLYEKGHRRNGSEPVKHERVIEDETDFSGELVKNWLNYDKRKREELPRGVCEEMMNIKLNELPSQDSKGAKKKEKKTTREPHHYTRPLRSDQVVSPDQMPIQKTTKSSYRTKIPDGNKWGCLACTFHNKPNVDVCEMCDKSRVQGNECLPLVSGGRTCHKCTLVNELGEEECKACGECLKGSPTYI